MIEHADRRISPAVAAGLPLASLLSDLVDGQLESEEWRAVGGTITLAISAPGVRATNPWLYQATITITGGVFVNGSGERVRQPGPITLTAFVGVAIGG